MKKALLINLALVLLVLVLAELVFGTWLSGPPWGTMNIPRQVNRQFDVSTLYAGGGVIHYRRDPWGLRGSYPALDRIDILTLGGSTTDQRFIDEAQTWQELLRGRFAADGRDISVVNAGIDGQSTIGHLAALQRWLPHVPGLKPRFILAYIGVNDLHVEGQGKFDAMQSPSRWRAFKQGIENNSALVSLWRTVAGNVSARKAHVVHGSDQQVFRGPWGEAAPTDTTAPKEQLDAYAARVAALVAAIRSFGAEAVIVTQSRADYRIANGQVLGRVMPNGSIDLGTFAHQNALNQRAMAACRAAGAICLDLGGEVTFSDEDFYDWVHTTPTGNARIADYLHRHLRDRLQTAAQ